MGYYQLLLLSRTGTTADGTTRLFANLPACMHPAQGQRLAWRRRRPGLLQFGSIRSIPMSAEKPDQFYRPEVPDLFTYWPKPLDFSWGRDNVQLVRSIPELAPLLTVDVHTEGSGWRRTAFFFGELRCLGAL